MFTKQVVFHIYGREESERLRGIQVGCKYVICACCGGCIPMDEVEILKEYSYWVDLTDAIAGDDVF